MHTDTAPSVNDLAAEAPATAVRVATGKTGEAKSHRIVITYPDGTTSEHGGKIAARATHAIVCYSRPAVDSDSDWYKAQRAGTWGHLAFAGRPDLAVKRYEEALSRWVDRTIPGDRVHLVAVTDAA